MNEAAEQTAACVCGHPFAGSHRTPGTECAEPDCGCSHFRAAVEQTSTELGDTIRVVLADGCAERSDWDKPCRTCAHEAEAALVALLVRVAADEKMIGRMSAATAEVEADLERAEAEAERRAEELRRIRDLTGTWEQIAKGALGIAARALGGGTSIDPLGSLRGGDGL